MSFDKRIYEQEFRLNDTDDSVIEYIQKHRKEMQHITIQHIAEELYISPNAIMRTTKKLGYSGFSELKFHLQQEGKSSSNRVPSEKEFDELPKSIEKTLEVFDEAATQILIGKILMADRILIIGLGSSTYYCELFRDYFRCIGRPIEFFEHMHDVEYAAKSMGEGDLMIFISASGHSERLEAIAKEAKKNKVDTCCISHYGKNPINTICDNYLYFWGERRMVNGYNVTDRMGLLMVIRKIAEEFWTKFAK